MAEAEIRVMKQEAEEDQGLTAPQKLWEATEGSAKSQGHVALLIPGL
jgi:hypothetical protein